MKLTVQQKRAYEEEKARIEALLESGNVSGETSGQYWDLVRKEIEFVLAHSTVLEDVDTTTVGLGTVVTLAIDGDLMESQVVEENYIPMGFEFISLHDHKGNTNPLVSAISGLSAGSKFEYGVEGRKISGMIISIDSEFAEEKSEEPKTK